MANYSQPITHLPMQEDKRRRFNLWFGKIPWSKKWQPTKVFVREKSHGQRSQVGYSSWGHKESDTTELLIIWWLRG